MFIPGRSLGRLTRFITRSVGHGITQDCLLVLQMSGRLTVGQRCVSSVGEGLSVGQGCHGPRRMPGPSCSVCALLASRDQLLRARQGYATRVLRVFVWLRACIVVHVSCATTLLKASLTILHQVGRNGSRKTRGAPFAGRAQRREGHRGVARTRCESRMWPLMWWLWRSGAVLMWSPAFADFCRVDARHRCLPRGSQQSRRL